VFLSNDLNDLHTYLNEDVPRPLGPQLLLKLYVPEQQLRLKDGTRTSLFTTESAREEHIYQSLTGLVLALGPECYKADSFKNWHQPTVGQWVVFRPNSGVRFNYKGVPLRFVYDDSVMAVVGDPSCVTLN
jgi:hypothetical protein